MHRMTTIAAVSLFLIFTSALSAAPKLAFQHSYFDFGYSPQDAKLTHTFWIKSVGDEVLKINDIKTGCSCTKAPLTKRDIDPGDSTELEVTFSTGRYKNRVLKKPTIYCNEGPEGRTATIIAFLPVDKDSVGPLDVVPNLINIPMDKGPSKTTAEFNIKNNMGSEIGLTLIDLPPDYFSVDLPESIPANGAAKGYIELTKKGTKNAFEKSFTFELNDKEKTHYSICVSRLITSDLQKFDEPIMKPSHN